MGAGVAMTTGEGRAAVTKERAPSYGTGLRSGSRSRLRLESVA